MMDYAAFATARATPLSLAALRPLKSKPAKLSFAFIVVTLLAVASYRVKINSLLRTSMLCHPHQSLYI